MFELSAPDYIISTFKRRCRKPLDALKPNLSSNDGGYPEFGVKVQILLDRHELAWGTVFELARGVTRGMWKFQDMTEPRLQQLKDIINDVEAALSKKHLTSAATANNAPALKIVLVLPSLDGSLLFHLSLLA
ncbi:hypothetical protein P692DRAFT_20884083 [Suillus brevipes Sb2]|nr:hypothetical protein P692DRAFT_20884083 [Suillus brevipes Sb2]